MTEQTPEPTEPIQAAGTTDDLETTAAPVAPVAPEATELLPEQPAARRGFAAGFHPVNILHLVLGVAFLGMTLNWALIESGVVETSGLRWLLPIPWVAAGAAGLIATAPRLRGR